MMQALFGGGHNKTETSDSTATSTTSAMDQFIKQAASAVGVDEAQAKNFVGLVLEQITKKTPEVTTDIESKISGARALIDETVEKKEDNEMLKPCMPVLDMLKNLIDQLTGGNAGMLEIVKKSGVTPAQGTDLLKKILPFLEEKLGAETVKKITSQVPALSAITA